MTQATPAHPDISSSAHRHTGTSPPIGVLVVNLGTPAQSTPAAVREFLGEFLSDRRVVNAPRFVWWFILNGYILNVRSRPVARLYEKIWMPEGSPLAVHTSRLSKALYDALEKSHPRQFRVMTAMRYGEPNLARVLDDLSASCPRLIILPLYPQYSAASTASVFDAIAASLKSFAHLPEWRFVNDYHDDASYIGALSRSLALHWRRVSRATKLVFSFHGLPRTSLADKDPYFYQCHRTARLVAEHAGLADTEWTVAFQSRFGDGIWLKPYLTDTLDAFAAEGIKTVHVMCPGFATDCLETLEEISCREKERFAGRGGELHYIPALNASTDHATALARIAVKHAREWLA